MRLARRWARGLLRLWFRYGRKSGWHYQVVERFGAGLAAASPLPARLPNRTIVQCDLREQIPRLIYFRGIYEPPEAFLFQLLLRPGWTVLDCGANLGQYTLLAATAVAPGGAVHSFEPVPSTAALLRAHLEANGLAAVTVTQAAVWHRATTVELGLAADREFFSGGFSIGVRAASEPVARQVTAAAIVLDDYVRSHRIARVHLVKMDIEGAEFFALQGLRQTLARDHPYLLMEICRPYALRLGYTLDEIWALLVGELGYQALAIGPAAADCRPLRNFDGIEQQNVLFHPGPLAPELLVGWDQRSLLRWSRQGWRRRR